MGKDLRVSSSKEAETEIKFELNVPSGIMVVANDLRPHFDFPCDFSVNAAEGKIRATKAMEEIGCAHGFVGNTCPGMYEVGENAFIIATPGHDEKTDEDVEPEGERVASIVTGLWWYSIVDGDEFKKRGCDKVYSDRDIDKVSVKPGVYVFTHYLKPSRTYDKPVIFTRIEWDRPIAQTKD